MATAEPALFSPSQEAPLNQIAPPLLRDQPRSASTFAPPTLLAIGGGGLFLLLLILACLSRRRFRELSPRQLSRAPRPAIGRVAVKRAPSKPARGGGVGRGQGVS